MKTKFRHIYFEQMTRLRWLCLSRTQGSLLASLEWYSVWKQWVLVPQPDTVFSADCLQDIITFISQLEKKQ
jgi:hypothetical protein